MFAALRKQCANEVYRPAEKVENEMPHIDESECNVLIFAVERNLAGPDHSKQKQQTSESNES